MDWLNVDGPLSLGLLININKLIIADTYNGILRSLDLADMMLSDFDEGSYTCTDNASIPGTEPAGVSTMPDGHILMVDTNKPPRNCLQSR